MKKYYFDFIIQKLKKDILCELLKEEIDHELIHKEVNLYFQNDIQFYEKISSSETHQIRPRNSYINKKDRCRARVWNEGEGGQCSFTGSQDGFCRTHFKKGGEQWFLGTIDKERPQRPILPSGEILCWNCPTASKGG